MSVREVQEGVRVVVDSCPRQNSARHEKRAMHEKHETDDPRTVPP